MHLTRVTVRSLNDWLLETMDRVDELENLEKPKAADFKTCGGLVHQAGDYAARLGFTSLYEKSLALAVVGTSRVANKREFTCSPTTAQAYLCDCIAACRNEKSNLPARISIGSRSASEMTQDEKLDCYAIAYNQWKEAEYSFRDSGHVTDRVAYEFLIKQLDETDSPMPKFETWSKYVRTVRARLGEQKNWKPKGKRITPFELEKLANKVAQIKAASHVA
jgi:hypothetical protein